MKKRAIILLLLNAFLTLSACATEKDDAVDNLVHMVRQELVVGMPEASVADYFRTKSIGYSYSSREELVSRPIQFNRAAIDEHLKGIYTGFIRDVESTVSVSTGIRIQVEIDLEGKVRVVKIDKQHTGL